MHDGRAVLFAVAELLVWISRSMLVLNHLFCGNSFIRRRELHNFSIRNVFITALSSLDIFPLLFLQCFDTVGWVI